MIQQQKDDLARLKFERDKWARMAASRRREAIELRKQRKFFDALIVDDRAVEYRRYRDQWDAEIKKIKGVA